MVEVGKRDADAAVGFAALTLGWNLYGFAGNFFGHYWPGWVTPIAYVVNLLLLAGLASVGISRERGPSLLALAGVVMAAWSLLGTLSEIGAFTGLADRPTGRPLNLPQPPPWLGPLVPTVTALLTAIYARRWSASLR